MLKSAERSDIEQMIAKVIQTSKRDSGINFHENIEYEENIMDIKKINFRTPKLTNLITMVHQNMIKKFQD